jgi:hypothetical protein
MSEENEGIEVEEVALPEAEPADEPTPPDEPVAVEGAEEPPRGHRHSKLGIRGNMAANHAAKAARKKRLNAQR